jgi:hypothetical protein
MDEVIINITETPVDNVLIEITEAGTDEIVISVSEALQGEKGDTGPPGQRGLTIATTQPTTPSVGDLWVDTSNN